jgi:hypothetical protein
VSLIHVYPDPCSTVRSSVLAGPHHKLCQLPNCGTAGRPYCGQLVCDELCAGHMYRLHDVRYKLRSLRSTQFHSGGKCALFCKCRSLKLATFLSSPADDLIQCRILGWQYYFQQSSNSSDCHHWYGHHGVWLWQLPTGVYRFGMRPACNLIRHL